MIPMYKVNQFLIVGAESSIICQTSARLIRSQQLAIGDRKIPFAHFAKSEIRTNIRFAAEFSILNAMLFSGFKA